MKTGSNRRLCLFALLAASPVFCPSPVRGEPATPLERRIAVMNSPLSFADFDCRARAGERLCVAFFGGSLTWGANASDPQRTSYRALCGQQLEAHYPRARFRFVDAAIGGVAVSRHQVGKGEVIVFWGTPDYRPEKLGFLMARAASWAGVQNPRAGNPVPLMIEGKAETTGRHYALLFQETPGHYVQRIPTAPDGQWFLDDMVSDRRLGVFSGQELRERGVPLDFL